MLRVIVAILTVGLLLTVLASTAHSAPGRLGGGRTAGAATRMIQLSVNSQGILHGAHYDLLSEETADIIRAIDKNTGRVS